MEFFVPTIFWVILICITAVLLGVMPVLTLCFYILFRVEVSYKALKYQAEISPAKIPSEFPTAIPAPNSRPQTAVKFMRESEDEIGPCLPNYVLLENQYPSICSRDITSPTPNAPPSYATSQVSTETPHI